ncbi:syl transferase, group 2 family domain protein [Burkholderia sp. ABCPW 111]|nr:syl transferase, group 2 family domain protein [Burkholderia sp. ABCPW 111]
MKSGTIWLEYFIWYKNPQKPLRFGQRASCKALTLRGGQLRGN